MHRVDLRCHEDNVRACRLYRRLGFVEIGREREAVYQEGRFADYIMFDMLDREFRARYQV
jgi:RimJ/RimL family protein N-acetyltransferase